MLKKAKKFILKAVLLSFIVMLPGAGVSALYAQSIPTSYSWTSTGPLISPKSDSTHNMIAVKDPSTVYYNGQYIVYASSVNSAGDYGMEYLHFTSWSQAGAATPYFMDSNPNIGSGYHTAPQVFYFAPQNKWYLIFQSGQPQYSTNSDPTQPQNWTAPQNFFASQPSSVSNWIDFWIISDSSNVYLFFCGDNGNFYRSSTSLANFPNGFNTPVIVYTDSEFNLFEADNVYTVEQTGTYLADIECIGSDGHRFFRALTATTLGGTWTALGDTASLDTPFLGAHNVTFQSGVSSWTDDFSSGGAVIDGYDSTDPINLNNLTFLYQGDNPNNGASSYNLIPWQLGLATSNANIAATNTSTPAAASTFTPTSTATPCATTPITPYIQVNGGAWQQTNSASVTSTASTVNLGPQPLTGGSWSWSGPNGFSSTSREIDVIPLSAGTDTFTATYTNACGLKSTEVFTITVQAAATNTPTYTFTFTSTNTFTKTNTPTFTPTNTFTKTNTPVPLTNTPTYTYTKTNTPVLPTNTPITPSATPTTPVPTNTPITPSATPTTPAPTNTPVTPSATPTTPVPTNTPITPSATPTTPVPTNTPVTPSVTPTTPMPTNTNTFTPIPTSTPVTASNITLQLMSGVTSDTTNSPHPQINVINTGTTALNLNNVEVRYWFNCDCTSGQAIQAWVDWAGEMPSGTNVTSDIQVSVMPTTLGTQTNYISIKFTGGITLQPNQYVQIQSRFNKNDWSNMLQDNDWSYAAYTSFTTWNRITAYENGSLVWGQEPSAGTGGTAQVASVSSNPNPSSSSSGSTVTYTISGSGVSAADANTVYSIPDPDAKVEIKIFTISGRLIWKKELSGVANVSTGKHAVNWNGKTAGGETLAPGTYVLNVIVISNGQVSSKNFVIVILK